MVLYIENPKESTKRLLETINEYSQITGYKINIQKSVVFLYTNNEVAEREIKNTIPFTIATKRIKYLQINLTKDRKSTRLNSSHANISYAVFCLKKKKTRYIVFR